MQLFKSLGGCDHFALTTFGFGESLLLRLAGSKMLLALATLADSFFRLAVSSTLPLAFCVASCSRATEGDESTLFMVTPDDIAPAMHPSVGLVVLGVGAA